MVDLQQPVTAAASPATPRRRRPLRAALVTVVSVAVVVLALGYVLAPSGASVRLAVAETATAQHYDADAAPHYTLVSARTRLATDAKAPTETIYGVVIAHHVAVGNISLRVSGAERSTRGQGATISIARSDVTYRSSVHLPPGRYRLTLGLSAAGHYRTVQTVETLRDGHFYRVSAKARATGVVTFLPVTTY